MARQYQAEQGKAGRAPARFLASRETVQVGEV